MRLVMVAKIQTTFCSMLSRVWIHFQTMVGVLFLMRKSSRSVCVCVPHLGHHMEWGGGYFRRVKITSANLVHAQMHALWYLWLAWDATHLPLVWHPRRTYHNNRRACSEANVTLSGVHLRPQHQPPAPCVSLARDTRTETEIPHPEVEKIFRAKNLSAWRARERGPNSISDRICAIALIFSTMRDCIVLPVHK